MTASTPREVTLDQPEIVVQSAVTPDGVVSPATIEVDNGFITAVNETSGVHTPENVTLVPGFIDIQVNGLGGTDVASATAGELLDLDQRLAVAGTTTWFPTVVTRPLAAYVRPLEAITSAMAEQSSRGRTSIGGAHLEGPFLGARPGAHREELIVDVDLDFLTELPEAVRLMTIAPESPGACEATTALVRAGATVSIGHTAATERQLDDMLEAGASVVTHLFNAMPGLHHRDVTVTGWALANDDVTTCVIADNAHVSKHALTIALRCKPTERLIVVSDSVAHLVDGELRPGLVGGGGGHPAVLNDGTIAGGTSTMSDCFTNLVAAGADLSQATAATSTNQSRLLGLTDRGEISVGKRADLVAIDDDLAVAAVWVAGKRLVP